MKKKVILFVCAIMCVSFICCSCNKNGATDADNTITTPAPVYSLMPADILTADNLKSLISYSPVCENLESSENKKAVLYKSEPLGLGDTVQISVMQYTNSIPKEAVKTEFDANKSARTSSEDIVLSGGCEGFIAFPSVHIYRDGYYVTITAGSGSGDEQKQLLTTAAELAVGNLKMLIGEGDVQNISGNTQEVSNDKQPATQKPQATLSIISVNDDKKADTKNNDKDNNSDNTDKNDDDNNSSPKPSQSAKSTDEPESSSKPSSSPETKKSTSDDENDD